jgi:hypothetical protein
MRAKLHLFALMMLSSVGSALLACTPTQLRVNTLEQIASITDIRYDQLLTTISSSISLAEPVPALGVISSGTVSNTDTGTLALVLPAMNFSKNSKSLNPTATITWTDNWSIGPISDPQDLQNLRALYSFLYRSDEDVARFVRMQEILYEMADPSGKYRYPQQDCGITYKISTYDKKDPKSIENSINSAALYSKDVAVIAYLTAFTAYPPTQNPAPEDQLQYQAREDCFQYDTKGCKRFTVTNYWTYPTDQCLKKDEKPDQKKLSAQNQLLLQQLLQQLKQQAPGAGPVTRVTTFYGLRYPTPDQVRDALRNGNSFQCRDYELRTIAALWALNPTAEPTFARWLFWRDTDGRLRPRDPLPTETLEPLGSYGGKEFYTASRACLNDFLLLAIASTANSHAAAQASPKSPTTNSP